MVSFFSRKNGRSTPSLASSSPRTISPMQAVETLLDSSIPPRQPPSSFKYNPTGSAKSNDSVQSLATAPAPSSSPAPVPVPKSQHRLKVSTSLARTQSQEGVHGASPRRPTVQAVVAASPSRSSPQRPVRPAEGLFDSPSKSNIALPGPPPTVPLPPTPEIRRDGRRMSVIDTRALAPQGGSDSSGKASGITVSQMPLPYSHPAPTAAKHSRAASAATSSMSRSTDKPLTRQRSSTYHTGLPEPPTTPTHSRRPSTEVTLDETPKHRPAALKLRTSNLTPSPHVSPTRPSQGPPSQQNEGEGDSRLAYLHPSHLRRTESASALPSPSLVPSKFSRRRSASTGDAFGLPQQHELESGPAVRTPQRRPSHVRNKSSTSAMSASTISSVTSTPSTAFPASASRRSFENLPLPWSTVSAYELEREIGRILFRQHVDTTLASLAQSSPRLLGPAALRTSISEDARLRSELDRLKDKYDKLLAQRDKLFGLMQDGVRGDRGTMSTLVDALGKVTARCDRVARQVFICNDQIRQIELQGEEHILGSVLLSLRRQNSSSSWRLSTLSGASQVSTARATIRDSTCTLRPPPLMARDQSGEAPSTSSSSSHTPQSTRSSGSTTDSWTPESTPTMSDIVVLQPVKDHDDAPSRISKIADSRRTSTATVISFGNIGRFPVPPHRRTGSDETDRALASPLPVSLSAHERIHERDTIAAFVGRYASPTTSEFWMSQRGSYASFSTQMLRHHSAQEGDTGDDNESFDGEGGIVILPPGSTSLASPLRGEMPMSARWPTTPLMIVSDGRSLESEPASGTLTGFEPRGLPVAPLRLPMRPKKGSKAQSLKIPGGRGRSKSAEGVRRTRRGRDTQLETPESILLSLATAELWTKQGFGQA